MNQNTRVATGLRNGIRCAGCGAPILRRRELVVAVRWFIRLETYCPRCFAEMQKPRRGRRMAFSGTKRMSDFLWAPMWIPFAGCWGAVYAVRGSWADLLLLCLALPQAALGAWMLGLRVWVYVRIERPMIKAQRERVCNPTPRNGGFPGAGRAV